MSGNGAVGLLPDNALSGIRLGISVSESSDLARLGLLESHFRLVLGEIARCILVSGGHIVYGGHLDPNGYTAFMVHELARYSRRDRPLQICLSWSEHRTLPLSRLVAEEKALGLYAKIVYLDPDGNPIEADTGRTEEPPGLPNAETTARSLTGLRRYMTENTHGRLFVGGKREDFQGAMPGLVEEAIMSLEQGKPIYLAGGLGGVTYDLARALGVTGEDWFPALDRSTSLDDRLAKGLERVTDQARAARRRSLDNGLSGEENQRLSACHRPSEVAALISVGLGRRFRETSP